MMGRNSQAAVEVNCPTCGDIVKVPDSVDGGNVHCSFCGCSFQAAPEIAVTNMIQSPWLKCAACLLLVVLALVVFLWLF